MTSRYPLVLNGSQIQELQSGDTLTGLTGFAASGTNSDITSLSALVSYTETIYSLGTSGTISLDPANGTIQTCNASGDITFTNASFNAGQSLTLIINGGNAHTITWPSPTAWVSSTGNTAPTLTANSVVAFWKTNAKFHGAFVGSYT